MPHRDLVVSGVAGGRRAALLEDGTLRRLAFDGDARTPRAGDVILGRVRKVSADLGAAFVDVGDARDGLLMRNDWGADAISEGAAVPVRVLRAATPGKGAKLARAAVQVAGRPPATISRGPSPVDVLLTEALARGVDAVTCDDGAIAAALRRAPGCEAIVTLLPAAGSAFRALAVDAEVEAALAPVIPLPGGGRVTITETAAFVAIDVDSGGARDGVPARTALAVNREAAAAIGRAIRLRELAGTLVIDFVAMSRADHRALIETAVRTALGGEDRHTALGGNDRQLRIAGFTRLGLFEIRRERRGPSLGETRLTRCPACDGSGRVAAPAETARRALEALSESTRGRAAGALRIVAAPPVIAALTADGRALLAAAEAALGRPITVAEDAALPLDTFRLEEQARGGETGR